MTLHLINHPARLDVLEPLRQARILALDVETAGRDGLVPQRSRIRLLQLAIPGHTFIFDCDACTPPEWLWQMLEDAEVLKILHNAKFDAKHIYHHYGRLISPLFCTFIASQLLALGNDDQRHSLAATCRRYLGREIDKSQQKSDWNGPLNEQQILYAAADVEMLLELQPIMAEKLKTLKLGRVSQLEFRTILPVALMEWKGLRVDAGAWEAMRPALQAEAQQRSERLLARLRRRGDLPGMHTLNLQSPEQVLEALQDLGLLLTGTSEAQLRACAAGLPTGEPGAEAIGQPNGRQIIEELLAYRHLAKLLGSTMQQVVQAILPETGRVHPSYHQIASASGRFACSEPNIQQVPREKEIRACFRPAEGYAFLVADYSQVELRVAAGLSGDATMLEAYRHGQDLHRLTAAITTKVAPEEVSTQARQAAKAINFGLIYAMGPQGLMQSARSSYGVEMTFEQATLFRNRFFQNYTGIRRWQEELERTGRKNRYIRTAAGRIRSYEGEEIRVTELFNVPVQGTAAEGLKSALCIFLDRVRSARLEAWVVAIIHDEIVVEVRQDQAEEALAILRQAMVEGIQWLVPGVPFAVDARICQSWGDK